mgnify:CR=1 FL=1
MGLSLGKISSKNNRYKTFGMTHCVCLSTRRLLSKFGLIKKTIWINKRLCILFFCFSKVISLKKINYLSRLSSCIVTMQYNYLWIVVVADSHLSLLMTFELCLALMIETTGTVNNDKYGSYWCVVQYNVISSFFGGSGSRHKGGVGEWTT